MAGSTGLPKLQLSTGRLGLLAVIAAIAISVAFLPAPVSAPKAMWAMAIVMFTVIVWATGSLPTLYGSTLFFALALAAQVAPPVDLFSGFWSNAAALVFGGLILGASAERSGLGRWVARRVLTRFFSSYPKLIAGVLIGMGTLTFLIPSTMGRLAIALPIMMAAAREVGYEQGSRGYIGVVVTTVAGNFLTSYAVMPANLTNIIALGTVENLYDMRIHYAEYLFYNLPVLGLLKGFTFWLGVVLFLQAPPPRKVTATEAAEPLSPAAKRLSVVFAITIAFWATDVIHGIKPGPIALVSAAVCLIPQMRLARLDKSFDLNKITAIVSLAAVLGVATVLTHSGAGKIIADVLSRVAAAEGQTQGYGFLTVALMATAVAAVATVVGAIAIVSPVLGTVQQATSLSIEAGYLGLMTGLQSIFFPAETIPIMVGLQMGKVEARSVLRLLIPLGISGVLIITPLNLVWLHFIGVLQ